MVVFNYNGNELEGGVYKITNLSNGHYYLGSVVKNKNRHFHARINEHLNSLKMLKHDNFRLQAAWNRDGEESFSFEIMEVNNGALTDVRKREQYYLNEVMSKGDWGNSCYNMRKDAIVTKNETFSHTPEETRLKLSLALSGLKRSDETKTKIAKWSKEYHNRPEVIEALKERNKNRTCSAETKIKIGLNSKNMSKHSRQKISNSLAKTHKFISPVGEVVEIFNLKTFCAENNLAENSMHHIKTGRQKVYKGWTKYTEAE